MSWADDIRCLFCDGRLPLYRKITNGQFCSAAHRKAYWQEQERLAVERLHQTHNKLQAFRQGNLDPKLIESILGPMPAENPAEAALAAPAADSRPWATQVNLGQVPMANFAANLLRSNPRWPQDGLAGHSAPLEYATTLRRPFHFYQPYDCGFGWASAAGLHLPAARAGERPALWEPAPLDVVLYPMAGQMVELQPLFEAIETIEEECPPLAAKLMLSRPEARRPKAGALTAAAQIETRMRAQLPLDAVRIHAALAPAELLHAGLRQLPMTQIALVHGPWIDNLRGLDPRVEMQAPLFTMGTPPLRPRLQLAPGRRYAVSTRGSEAPAAQPSLAASEQFAPNPPEVSLPFRAATVLRAASPTPTAGEPARTKENEPQPTGLLPLTALAKASNPAIEMRRTPEALSLPQTPRSEPLRPSSKLEPLEPKPEYEIASALPPEIELPSAAVFAPPAEQVKAQVWMHAVDFWKRAPRDLKVLVFAIPLLLGLALHPALPKVRVAAPAKAATIERNVQKAWNDQLVNVRQSMVERAAVALDEDFRSGLDDWTSRGESTTEWSFDATGFVKPGPLALYRPSMTLTDYQAQFLGIIDKKALSWVVRAADFKNFYVVKLVVLKPGPLPTIGVTRYAVVDGKADSRIDTVAAIDARQDMLYRVVMDVHGDDFVLTVQGQLVDAWSEPRLKHGGIGLFSAKGEESRIRWVQITHQYDMLGRLCAYLAPYNISTSSISGSGSLEQ